MSNSDRLPIRDSRPEPQPIKRDHSAHYYARRVGQSFTTQASKVLCAIFLFIFIVVCIVCFILWLILRPHRPQFHMIDFTVPGMAAQPSGLNNAQIMFNITARNSNQHIGILYDSMVGSVFYKDRQILSTSLLEPFFQEPKTTRIVDGTATIALNFHRWQEFMNDRSRGTVIFRLDIKSVIRFKVLTWISDHHKMHVNCDVAVGSDGSVLSTWQNKRCDVYFSWFK